MPMIWVDAKRLFDDYSREHGGVGSGIKYTSRDGQVRHGTIYFPDGSSVSEGMDVCHEPSGNLFERLHAQREYCRQQLMRAEENFGKARAELVSQASLSLTYKNLPPPPDDADAILAKIKADADKWAAKVAEFDDQIAATPEMAQRRELQRFDDDRRRRTSETVDRLQAINLR